MFIISCDDDNSYCLVHDKDVIQDDEVSAGEDDTIMFYYKKKVCYGKIVFYSGNDDEIDAKWVELTKPRNRKLDKLKFDKKAELSDEKCRQGRKRNSSKVSAKEDDKRSHKLETPVKKVKEPRKKTEPKNLEANQSSSQVNSLTQDDYKRMYLDLQKKMDDERKSSNVKNKSPGLAITSKRKNKSSSSETESFNSSTEDPFMDTSKSDDTGGESTLGENDKTKTEAENNSLADELGEKEKSAGEKEIGASAIEDNLGNKSKNKTDIEATQPEYYDENIQLLGPNHGEKMIEFVPNIFCIKKKLDIGQDSGEATVLARCLMEGIFKQEELLRCTFSGQAARAQGPEKNKKKVEPLHHAAKTAIIKYALNYSKEHGWKKKIKNGESTPYNESEIKRSMTQRIGEIKREHAKNLQIKPPTAP